MEALFGIPASRLAAMLLGATLLLLAVMAGLAWRRRMLLRMGIRNAARRRVRAVVIVAGLMLSTLVVSTAFATGDAMTWTVRSLVAGSAGSVDEVVTAPQRDFTQLSSRNLQDLAAGTLSIVPSSTFAASEYNRLQAAVQSSRSIEALLPAYALQAPVAAQAAQLAHPDVSILAVPPVAAGRFALRDGSGGVLNLGALGATDVIVNRPAADLLGSGIGSGLRIYLPDAGGSNATGLGIEHDFTVGALAADGALAGPTPTIFIQLAALQAALGQDGQLNEILVLNRCGGDPQSCSAQATLDLRRLLVDRPSAERIRAALAGSNGAGVLRRLASRRSGAGRDQVLELQRALKSGYVTDQLLYLLGDPQIAGTLRATAGFLPTADGRVFSTLRTLNRLSVVEVKRNALNEANDYGSTLTSVFLVLGLFSIASSLLLVFLVFVLLAAERRSELGISRAIGLRRSHLVQSFTFEGIAYDLAAAALGALAGIGVSGAIVWLIARALRRYGISVSRHVELRSVLIAFCLGLLVTLFTVVLAAWRVSRLNIVEAIRGVARDGSIDRGLASAWRGRFHRRHANVGEGGAVRRGVAGSAGARAAGAAVAVLGLLAQRGLLLVPAGVVLLLAGAARHQYLLFALGASTLILAGALILRWLLVLCMARTNTERLCFSLAGAGLTTFWALPARAWHAGGSQLGVGSIETFAVAGVMMVLGSVCLIAYNVAGPLQALARAFGRGGAATTVVRLAVAYPLQHRARTGLAIAMFALVVFTMVVAAVLLDSAQKAYVAREQPPSGYDISATAPAAAGLTDMAAELAKAPASAPTEFAGVGSLATWSAQIIETTALHAGWSSISVALIDSGFAAGTPVQLSARATGYPSDAAIWQALANVPGTALVSRLSLGDGSSSSTATVRGISATQRRFAPFAVWLRDTAGAPVRLTVIGVADDRAVLPSGLLTLRANVPLIAAQTALPDAFLFKTAPGRDPSQAAVGLQLSFGSRGLRVSVVGEGLRNVQTLRRLLNYLLEGFVGLGLVSGMAALGVISTRAVVERRQEIGMLRALGMKRRIVQISFLLEVSFVALLGIVVGVVLGLLLASDVIAYLSQSTSGLQLTVPWPELGLITVVAYIAAMLTTLSAAWQAGRVSPAEALRYE